MRRRLDLAATLVAAPEVLFLDEPTTGLDPRARNELWDVLDRLVDGGATILLTTQYLEEADRLADDIVVIDHGRVIARGDARSLKRELGGDQLHVVCVAEADLDAVAEILERITGAAPAIDRGGAQPDRADRRRGRRDRRAGGRAGRAGDRRRGPRAAPADARRRVPDPDGRPGRAGGPRDTRTGGGAMRTAMGDTWVIARRGLKHLRRQPEMLADATIQPIMFVLLFAFVFGGAIAVPGGGSYREFLMGGIFAQTIVFGAFGVAIALAYDRTNGAIDRFHSLPIPRAAVLAGHAVASLIKSLLPIVLMSLAGLRRRLADPLGRRRDRSPATR